MSLTCDVIHWNICTCKLRKYLIILQIHICWCLVIFLWLGPLNNFYNMCGNDSETVRGSGSSKAIFNWLFVSWVLGFQVAIWLVFPNKKQFKESGHATVMKRKTEQYGIACGQTFSSFNKINCEQWFVFAFLDWKLYLFVLVDHILVD